MALLPPALLLFYVLAVDRLGFLATAAVDRRVGVAGARRPPDALPFRSRSLRRSSCIWSSPSSCACRCRGPGADAVVSAMSTIIEAFWLVLQTDVLLAILLCVDLWPCGRLVARACRRPWRRLCWFRSLSISRRSPPSPPSSRHRRWRSSPAIFPARLLRIPGTPASAAYTDEAYAMTRKGQPELALGIGLWFSALGGIAGTLSLIAAGAAAGRDGAEFLDLRIFLAGLPRPDVRDAGGALSPVKAIASMLLGLLVSCIGIENPGRRAALHLRLTDLLGGIEPIPALVGVFAVSEVMRAMLSSGAAASSATAASAASSRAARADQEILAADVRGNIVGIIIGVLPGAGADMAAWVSYAMSKRFSKEPEKFGTGHVEGLVEAGASNNASLASGWVPSLLFGIPGDTITAIAIGVLYMKGLNPGPTLFTERRRACMRSTSSSSSPTSS